MSEENNTNEDGSNEDTLLEFPCEFQVKAIGLQDQSFELLVIEIINKHVEKLSGDAVTTRASGNAKYLSVSVTITATSKRQLDAIYIELSGHDRVVMAL